MLGESQDDAGINTLARGFRRDFGRGLSSSSEIESSEESLIVNGRNGVIEKDRFLKEAREELEARLEKEIDEQGQSSEASPEPEKPDFKSFGLKTNINEGFQLPEWMHGIEGFAEVIKNNSSMILESLTSEDRDQIYALLPKTESKEKSEVILKKLLTSKLPQKFGQTPLDAFGKRLEER